MSRMTHPGRSLIHIHKFVYLFSCVVSYSQAYLRSYFNLSSISSLCYSIAFLWNQMVALWFSVFLHLSIRCIAVVLRFTTVRPGRGVSHNHNLSIPYSDLPLMKEKQRKCFGCILLCDTRSQGLDGIGFHVPDNEHDITSTLRVTDSDEDCFPLRTVSTTFAMTGTP